MALECRLCCRFKGDEKPSEAQLYQVVQKYCPEAEKFFHGQRLQFQAPGVLCTVLPSSERWQSLIQETYGFTPDTDFYFRLDKFDLFDAGVKNAERITIGISCEVAQQYVFFVGDDAIMLKTTGQLITQKTDDPARLKMLNTFAQAIGLPSVSGELPTC